MGYSVYRHTTPSGKVYIGITEQPVEARWRNGKGYANNNYFSSAIEKYGWEHITHEVLYTGLTKDEAEERERSLIKESKSTDRNFGYNILDGGNISNVRWKHTPDAKRKISEAGKGRKLNENQLKKVREYANSKKRPVDIYNLFGELLSECSCVKEAENFTNIHNSNISACCKGRYEQIGGYVFRYHGEPFTKPKSAHRRPVIAYDTAGNVVCRFQDAAAAGRHFGVNRNTILKSCSFETTEACGLLWLHWDETHRLAEKLEQERTKKDRASFKPGRGRIGKYRPKEDDGIQLVMNI